MDEFNSDDHYIYYCGQESLKRNAVALIAEKAMAPHSSTFAWKILWTEKLGGLQSMGSLRVRYD